MDFRSFPGSSVYIRIFFTIFCVFLSTQAHQLAPSILALPWSHRTLSDHHRLSPDPSICGFSVNIVESGSMKNGLFTTFVLLDVTYVVHVTFFDGQFSIVQVNSLDASTIEPKFTTVAATRLRYQILDVQAKTCDEHEAYVVVTLSKDGMSSELQLLVFKLDERLPGSAKYVIAHNGQLSSAKGVSDVDIACFEKNLIFSIAVSPVMLPSSTRTVQSSIRVWNPKSRTVVKVISTDTLDAVSVTSGIRGRCLLVIFGQSSHDFSAERPLDTLVYCVSLRARNDWRIQLMQQMRLCAVNGLNMYLDERHELHLLLAIARTDQRFANCQKRSVAMTWNSGGFNSARNVSVTADAEIYHFPTPCCNILATRRTDVEKTFTIAGSSETLFRGVQKVDHISVRGRFFLLISFVAGVQQAPLHEIHCVRSVAVYVPVPAKLMAPQPVRSLPLVAIPAQKSASMIYQPKIYPAVRMMQLPQVHAASNQLIMRRAPLPAQAYHHPQPTALINYQPPLVHPPFIQAKRIPRKLRHRFEDFF